LLHRPLPFIPSRSSIRVTILALGLGFLWGACLRQANELEPPVGPFHGSRIGDLCPDLPLGLPGTVVSVSSFSGQVLLLHFWASWCPNCVTELAELAEVARRMEGEGIGLAVVALNMDLENVQDLRRFTALRAPLLSGFDPGGEQANALEIIRLPHTLVLDRHGVIVDRILGGTAWTAPPTLEYLRTMVTP